ncbi:MAG TPA: hypothetical protein VFY83_11250, partial [Anaerolineales bacterium]|nr:hypothetical protein [Anaerolineales bacterium]
METVRRILILLFVTTALVACQPGSPSTQVPAQPVQPTDSPESLPESSATGTPVPTLPQETTAMTPVTPPDETAEKMVALVKEHLANRLSIAVGQIVLSEIKPVVWRDAGLGCPKPGVDYIQVETPGYNILLQAG